MHPSKQLIVVQISPIELVLLFVRGKEAEELRFKFSKALKIFAFSFCFGSDFNFMVCTNNMIYLYEIKLSSKTFKIVKTIPTLQDSLMSVHFEPMANTLVLIDSRAHVQTYFLNLHLQKQKIEGKACLDFKLDISIQIHTAAVEQQTLLYTAPD